MGFRVFGAAEVLSVHVGDDQQAAHVRKQAHRAVFAYVPRKGMVYVRSRAISSRCNDNFDMFPAEEIEKSYQTFIGKPVFVNHHNSDHRQMRGVVIDAALHRDRNPGGSPDTWVEVLMEIDGLTYPKLAKALISGDIDRTSMGCDVEISKCSICANVAKNPLEYCRHIPAMKGKVIYALQPDGTKAGKLVYEVCSGLKFFENSVLVEPPADPTAFFLGNVDLGPGLEHIARAARLTEAANETPEKLSSVGSRPATMARTASLRTASKFLDDYPSDDEIDERRQGGFGGQEPWHPYKHQLESRPEPREFRPPMIKGRYLGPQHGTVYEPVPHGTPGAQMASSPEDEYHGPYEVIKHPDTGMHHVVDNQGRATRYGGGGPTGKGIEDRFQAEHARDYAEHKQQSKEKAKGLADKLWGGMHEIFDPGGTTESRESERNVHSMNNLQNLGYQPHHIKFDDEDGGRPYAEIEHKLPGGQPSGWYGQDHGGGGYLHIMHRATGDEAHDVINLGRNDSQSGRIPGYGPAEAEHDLHHWHSGDPEETGGNREYLEKNDPRIQRWKQRHTGSLQVEASFADDYLKDHTPHPDHLVKRFNQSSKRQRDEGMRWYEDAHNVAKMIGQGDVHKGAGLVGLYSEGTGLATNYHTASRAALQGRGLGGKKTDPGYEPGTFATKSQADRAEHIIKGGDHRDVVRAPKTSNFAHLIENAGNHPDSLKSHVVIDRHAISAATDHKISNADFGKMALNGRSKKWGTDGNKTYALLADTYRAAADSLSKEHGYRIHPHQVQAVTWLVQRDLNDAAEDDSDPKVKGRRALRTNEAKRWSDHVQTNYPEFADETFHRQSAIRREGYGETKAPQNVNTLREESCPICGNDVAFDGSQCQVCGYISPPKGLDDPDVDKAKQLDQLKTDITDARNDSGLDPSQNGAPFDAGDTSQIEPGGDNSADPWLQCTNCGTSLRPSAPQTTSTDPALAPPALGEGDPCPICGDGALASTGESEDDTDPDLAEEEDPSADEDGDGIPDDEEAPEADPDADDEPDEDKKSKKNPVSKASMTMKYRDHLLKENRMPPTQNGLQQLLAARRETAELRSLVEYQQHTIAQLHQRANAKDSQVRRLTAAVQVIAENLGPDWDLAVRTAMVRKTADEQNPAQPVPEPAPQPPTQTSVEAETPEAFADVNAPGMVPGSNQDVPADAVTTTYTPGQDIGTPPVRQLVDVTAPIAGAQGPRPLSETKTNVDVRVGNPMNPQVAFPLGGPFANAQRTSALQQGEGLGDIRVMASIRLARLRLQAGIEQGGEGSDLLIGQKIASDPSMTMERINAEIGTLNQVRTAAANRQQVAPPRAAVPQSAQPTQGRLVPPLTSTASLMSSNQGEVDPALEAVFM